MIVGLLQKSRVSRLEGGGLDGGVDSLDAGAGAVTSTGLTGAASRAGAAAWFPRPLGKRLFLLLGSLGLFLSSMDWVQPPTLCRVICLLQDVGHLHKPSQRHLGRVSGPPDSLQGSAQARGLH